MQNRDQLLARTEAYLKGLFAEASGLPAAEFDAATPFGELGVDSFRVLKILKALEADFGSLPKTLLFENFNLESLTSYFVDRHAEALQTRLSSGSAATPTVGRVAVPAKTVAPIATPPGPRPPAPSPAASLVAQIEPLLLLEADLPAHPQLQAHIEGLYARHKNEGCVSRGTRDIAPNLFIGSRRRGYFNYARSRTLILVYAFTGPRDYFAELAAELQTHCQRHGLLLNVFADETIEAIGETAFSSTPFGALQRVCEIRDFSLQGSAMRRLRYLLAKFEKAGPCRTVEYLCGSQPQVDQEIAAVIDAWCASKPMVNPLIARVREEILQGRLHPQHRLFITYQNDRLQNVILISRLCDELNGYLMDLEFYGQDMPLGGLDYAIVRIIEALAAEGCDLLSLGGTYGCRLERSPLADPAVDRVLDDLHRQGIFNDAGNLQFKNKFRPQNRSIYLCRPREAGSADSVLDLIMMIADPERTQTNDAEHHNPARTAATSTALPLAQAAPSQPARATANASKSSAALDSEAQSRLAALAGAGFNPLHLADAAVEFEHKTDSWAQLRHRPEVAQSMLALRSDLQTPIDLQAALRELIPFRHIALTESGRSADELFCKAWARPGLVPQNLLFPTCLFHQIDKGFSPQELPHPSLFAVDTPSAQKAELDLDALKALLATRAAEVAYVCVELSDNASGGQAVSLRHLRELRALLDSHGLSLVIDATRVLENAHLLVQHDSEHVNDRPWALAHELLAQAHVLIGSLAKDFGLDRGGLIASDDEALLGRVHALMSQEGGGLTVLDKKLVGLAFSRRSLIEQRVSRRLRQVEQVWHCLDSLGLPLLQPAGAHCVLIDVKRLPDFNALEHPVAAFLAWLYLHTGIRAGAHSVGMQKNGPINDLVRLAIPQGLDDAHVQILCERLRAAFAPTAYIPELSQTGESAAGMGELAARYALLGFSNAPAASSETPISGELEMSGNDQTKPSASAAAALRPAERAKPGVGAKVTTQSLRDDQGLDIAVIGMAGRYPQADDLHAFWQNLRAGRDCISELPAQRRAQRAGGACNRDYRGGFLDAIDRFDSMFFNISPREAEMLDPQERIFLEVAWETLEDSGYYPELLAQEGRRDVGVFVGAVWALYQILGVEAKLAGGEQHPNSFLWSIANRVSYWMNFTGPSLTVDTACSSSLTAIYLACEAIRRGDCSSALVGGVNLDLHQHKFDINHAGGALSADGVCRSFGEGANGYVAGEGVGAILLKPLAQALADHDQIYGVIRGAASNHGGRTSGYTVPNPKAQAELIGIALRRAGVDARSIGYIEAHGTGTELGDPIEIAGLSQAFARDGVAAGQCPIGSVKTNIGHLEAGAGLVGLSKVLLQMRERELVPSLHAERLNPHIEFEHSPFHVQRQLQPWRPQVLDGVEQPLRAGVSSFGAGGANAHVVVEECRVKLSNETVPDEGYLFPLSARNEEQLKQMAQRLLQRLGERTHRPRLCDLAYTLQNGRKSFEHRAAIIAADYPALLAGLEALASGRSVPDLHCGHARAADGLTRLLDREERERFIELLMQGRDPHKLARLWIDGLLSDCRGLVQGDARRVSLPTYPFADKRHWIATAAATAPRMHSIAAGPALHPLIDTNESTFSRQLFRKRFHANEFFLREHVVSGLPTLPGTAYLDLARRAGELATGLPVRRIRNITWVSPLSAVEGGVVDVLTELKPAAEAVQFEVFSERADGSRQLYAQGKLEFAVEPAAAEFIDLAAIQSRCTRLLGGDEAYPLFAQFGLDYGPSFRLLREVHRTADEVLGLLQLPVVREADFDAFVLHPCVIDAAMQAGVVGQLGQSEGQMKVPYSITEVELLHPLSRTCYSHVTRTPGTRESSSGVSRENVCIVDENGRVLVRLRESIGVPLTSVHEKPAPRALGDKGSDKEGLDERGFDELYYRPQWLARALPEFPSERGDVLLFDRDPRRAEALRALGLRVHCVLPGDAFEDLGDDNFRVQPRHKQDYALLLAELRSRAALPTRICIGWGSTESAADAEALQAALDGGVYALLSLSQALIECKLEGRLQLVYLHSRSPGEVELPEHAGLDGFLRSLRLENPRIDAKRLQLDSDDVTLAARILLHELHSAAQLDLSVRYRAGLREVRSLVRLSDAELPAAEASALPLRQGGVYLITGGAGGLGLIFAEFLARQCQAKLVLSGRSPLSSERSDDLQRLRDLGAEVEYLQADVSEPSAARALIDHCQQAHGGLHGILHSAGVLRDSFLRNKTQEDMAAVLAPKVFGGFHLDRCSADLALDFFVCFSSLAAIGGNAGQCDYAYANCYMDALMAQREQLSASGQRSGRSLSLNWSLWADGGMRLDEQTEMFFRKTLGIRPLRREIGQQALLRALRAEPSQIAVLEAVREKIELAWGLAAPVAQPVQQASAPAAVVDKAAASSAGLHDAVIAELSGLVMEMLKLGADELSLDNILLDLGFDSIGLTSFANAINQRYLLDINPVLFFEYPSLRAITDHLLEEHAAAMAAAHVGSAGTGVDLATTASDLTTAAPTTPVTVSAVASTVSPTFGRKQWQAPSHASNSGPAGTAASPTNRFRDMPIAIVGMAGVMPQSDTLEEFWDHLANARNLVTEIPRDRWIWEQYDGNPVKEVNKSNSRWGGFMREVDKLIRCSSESPRARRK
jgi:polyketide synthase PksN